VALGQCPGKRSDAFLPKSALVTCQAVGSQGHILPENYQFPISINEHYWLLKALVYTCFIPDGTGQMHHTLGAKEARGRTSGHHQMVQGTEEMYCISPMCQKLYLAPTILISHLQD
jgi:hypothetical protein